MAPDTASPGTGIGVVERPRPVEISLQRSILSGISSQADLDERPCRRYAKQRVRSAVVGPSTHALWNIPVIEAFGDISDRRPVSERC
jgi:hypothetical protein